MEESTSVEVPPSEARSKVAAEAEEVTIEKPSSPPRDTEMVEASADELSFEVPLQGARVVVEERRSSEERSHEHPSSLSEFEAELLDDSEDEVAPTVRV